MEFCVTREAGTLCVNAVSEFCWHNLLAHSTEVLFLWPDVKNGHVFPDMDHLNTFGVHSATSPRKIFQDIICLNVYFSFSHTGKLNGMANIQEHIHIPAAASSE